MSPLIRQTILEASLSAYDKITVRNLEITAKAGVDVWGRQKQQRALVTVSLFLRNNFDEAAKTDKVDNSTVHYGTLSKKILAAFQKTEDSSIPWRSTSDFMGLVFSAAMDSASGTALAACGVDVLYPKGSMLGDGAGMSTLVKKDNGGETSLVLYLRNVRIPCIVGVNSNERLQKQPVVVNIWIDGVQADRSDDYMKLETVLFEAIATSSFETLESLSTFVVDELRQKFFTEKDADGYIRFRVEKPLAVPFADASAIEIVRPVKA